VILKGLKIAETGYGLMTASEDKELLRKQAQLQNERADKDLALREKALTQKADDGLSQKDLADLAKSGVSITPDFGAGPLEAGAVRLRTSSGQGVIVSSGIRPPQKENLVKIETAQGTQYLPESQVVGRTFRPPPKEVSESAKLVQAERDLKREEGKVQDLRDRDTPIGVARTAGDAKIIKDGMASKETFDRQLAKMISLREKYGGELANREAVAAGKQLSKDLLLTYKNMAKLGVLSQSDEEIINAIIPSDPLAFTASGIVGQDPIMTQLVNLRESATEDFNSQLKIRLDPNGPAAFADKTAAPQAAPNGAMRVTQDGTSFVWDGFQYVGEPRK
jgi:hypothetical protein